MAAPWIAIIGGGIAGQTAAVWARRRNERAEIKLFERLPGTTGGLAAPIPDFTAPAPGETPLAVAPALIELTHDIDVWTHAEAVRIDPERRALVVRQQAKEVELTYHALICAAGAIGEAPDVPGLGSAGRLARWRSATDSATVRAALAAGQRRVVLLGDRGMGLEAADTLVRAGAELTFVDAGDGCLSEFGRHSALHAFAALRERAAVRLGARALSAEATGGGATRLNLDSGESLEADLVVTAVRLRPQTELLAAAGADLWTDGSAIIDTHCRTSLPGIYACGGCVSVAQRTSGIPLLWPQASLARRTARVAGSNAGGADVALWPTPGTFSTAMLSLTVARTGLTGWEAEEVRGAGNVGVTVLWVPDRQGADCPTSATLFELVWDRRDGLVLGLEACGRVGVDRAVDAAAAAIAGKITVDELAQIDLCAVRAPRPEDPPLTAVALLASADRAFGIVPTPPEAVAGLGEETQWVDVRPENAPASPFTGALRLPLPRLRAELGRLDRTRPLVAFCQTGADGAIAARTLRNHGFGRAGYLAGGLCSWLLG